ncbi:MAG TPA: hypothetical protein ENN46_00635 [Candidatus Woesearchaeota archaeon]|nr:hypothetical protein [Candidatus Woesearchaeota archaeon]
MTWQEFAIYTGDVSKCDRASHPDVCRTGFAQATGDGFGCIRISDEGLRNTCFAFATGGSAERVDTGIDELLEEMSCRYDSDCDPVCVGNVAWKMGCNPRQGICIQTFDMDCSGEKDDFGVISFPKLCRDGLCVTDNDAIEIKRSELEQRKEELRNELRDENARRDSLIAVRDEAHKNYMGGLSDATAILIVEFSTRVAGVVSGGVGYAKDATSRVVDWTTLVSDAAGTALDKLYELAEDEKPADKITNAEYIKLNYDLHQFFSALLAESDGIIDKILEESREVNAQLNALP